MLPAALNIPGPGKWFYTISYRTPERFPDSIQPQTYCGLTIILIFFHSCGAQARHGLLYLVMHHKLRRMHTLPVFIWLLICCLGDSIGQAARTAPASSQNGGTAGVPPILVPVLQAE